MRLQIIINWRAREPRAGPRSMALAGTERRDVKAFGRGRAAYASNSQRFSEQTFGDWNAAPGMESAQMRRCGLLRPYALSPLSTPRTLRIQRVTEASGLTASERRLMHVCEASAPGAWDWERDTEQFLVNRRLRELFGLSDDDLVSRQTLVDATLPDDRQWGELILPEAGGASASYPALVRFRIKRADNGATRWIAARIWRNAEADSFLGYSGTVEDITEQTETARALIESEERLRLAIEAGRMAVWEVDLTTGAMTPSEELNVLLGFAPGTKPNLKDVRALYVPGEIERLAQEGATIEVVRARASGGAFEPWSKDALREGGDRTQVQAEVAIVTPAGVPKQLMLRAQFAPTPDGTPRLTGLLIDITEKKMAEERLDAIARELQHRVKNSLSIINAIASQSLRNSVDETALQGFLGRVSALGVATDLIIERGSVPADLRDLVEKITQPYRQDDPGQFEFEGPSVALDPRMATAVGMTLHELCTNAVKFGALSTPSGRVSVAWQLRDNDGVVLHWAERDGPPVVPPTRRGFGTRLLEQVLARELKGGVSIRYDPAGLQCRLEIGHSGLNPRA